jgi:hypothetical protein
MFEKLVNAFKNTAQMEQLQDKKVKGESLAQRRKTIAKNMNQMMNYRGSNVEDA